MDFNVTQQLANSMNDLVGGSWTAFTGRWVLAATIFLAPAVSLNTYFTRSEIKQEIQSHELSPAHRNNEIARKMDELAYRLNETNTAIQNFNELLNKDIQRLNEKVEKLEERDGI